ncbi:MAG: DinB family protein [Thermoanaerobaculia bacterium]
MSDIPFLSEQLRKGYSDDPWHGPATTVALEGVTAAEAAAHPVPGAHSIWEIVLHLTAWQNEVRRRLGGSEPAVPEEGDWPEPGEASEMAWRRDRELLEASLTELLGVMSGLAEKDLERAGGSVSDRDPALGTGVTHRAMVNGLVQHNAYHTGQIVLLRKALQAGR